DKWCFEHPRHRTANTVYSPTVQTTLWGDASSLSALKLEHEAIKCYLSRASPKHSRCCIRCFKWCAETPAVGLLSEYAAGCEGIV
ncbi:hypothetical protein T265_10004, partial [Opisthorchis viverrini]